ncbi:hypothetical protein L208DRAFT_1405762 [Tricholoma matsutake]|nr:hypothetical protein L208DRAFT_1405762 [Tricholoma matsutake 945]
MDKKLHAEAEGVKYIVFQVDSSTPDFFLNFARLSRRLPHGPHRRNVAQDFGRQPGRCTPLTDLLTTLEVYTEVPLQMSHANSKYADPSLACTSSMMLFHSTPSTSETLGLQKLEMYYDKARLYHYNTIATSVCTNTIDLPSSLL